MKRVLIRRPGGHEALEIVEEADPTPKPGEVLVRVKASGINYADAIVRMGHYEAAKGQYPITPGFEFAGTVAATGEGATRHRVGDRVFGFCRFGAYTSAISLPERQVYPCPDGWDFNECAGVPGVYLTAYHALFKVAKVERGERLLVHSAAGGVGTALLQLGRIAGCPAVGVVGSPSKAEVCKQLGAEAVILKDKRTLWKELDRHWPDGIDVALDANGVTTLKPAFERLRHGGRLVVYGFAEIMPRGVAKPNLLQLAKNYFRVPKFSPLDMTTTNRAVMGFNVVFLFHKPELADQGMGDIVRWMKEGKIRKFPVTAFPLERVADAHRAIESGTTTGKLVLTS
ncbi:MAG: zinc-binding dehydrogenase [Elusimicrobia bacterium]|nr:zinc-binding dehydrogenase [Elusimicrobiota bacterium]